MRRLGKGIKTRLSRRTAAKAVRRRKPSAVATKRIVQLNTGLTKRWRSRPRRPIIAKQHGGSIEVDTQPGEFTEIRVVLPRVTTLLPERS